MSQLNGGSWQLLELLARFGTYNIPKQLIYKKRVLVLLYLWIPPPIPALRTLTISLSMNPFLGQCL